jgi:hypothetical protein
MQRMEFGGDYRSAGQRRLLLNVHMPPFDAAKEPSNTATVLTLAAGQPIQPRSACTAEIAVNADRAAAASRAIGREWVHIESSHSPATLRHDGW